MLNGNLVVGRKAIMKLLKVDSWRTVVSYQRRDPEFAKLFLRDRLTGKPMLLKGEVEAFRVAAGRK